MPALSIVEPLPREASLTFAEVYERAFPWVYRAARRLGVATSTIDDVVQDVFLVVHRKLDSFEGRSSLRSWIYGITLRVVRDRRRSMKRKPECALDDDAVLPDTGNDPHSDAVRREAFHTLLRVLDRLTEEQREVFVLAELEELSAPEIAEALSTNLNTVYSRLRAARKSFEAEAARFRARERFAEGNPR